MKLQLENVDYSKLTWESDFNGEEIGYDDVSVVGHYSYGKINLFIDTDNKRVLRLWKDEEI